jgi:MarR family
VNNTGRILAALRAEPGLSDGELRQRTQVEPHQKVNQICRRLEQEGYLRRIDRADRRIGNYLTKNVPLDVRDAKSPSFSCTASPPSLAPAQPAISIPAPTGRDTLIVLPCSGRKELKEKGGTSASGRCVLDLLSPTLRDRLVRARHDVGAEAALDETRLLPAWHRYVGTLYKAANKRLKAAVDAGVPILIVSGGYGLVLAEESIGWYNRPFSRNDWPTQLLEECLLSATEALRVQKVVAFCARTTNYAKLVRRTRWAKDGIDAWLASPDMPGGGDARRLVPRACGEAMGAFLDGELYDRWVSTGGVPVLVKHLG